MNGQTKNAKRGYFQPGAKALCLVLALLFTVCLLPPLKVYADAPIAGGYVDNDNGNVARWSLYENGKLVIHAESETVTAMPELAAGDYGWCQFKNPNDPSDIHNYSQDITEVVITSNITTISGNAFAGCTNLESVTMADTVTSIGRAAFDGCTKLETVTFSKNLTGIGNFAFNNCGIKTVSLEEGVKTIGQCAFALCEQLTAVHIPSTVTSIEEDAFYGDNAVTDVYYNVTEKKWNEEFKDNIEDGNDILFSAAKHFLPATEGVCGEHLTWSYDNGTLTIKGWGDMNSFATPSGSESQTAPWKAFRESITKVVIEEGATSVGSCAFYGCSAITEVSLPSTLTTLVGIYNFYNCDSLTEIHIPNSVTTIGTSVFKDCAKLETVTLSNSLTVMMEAVFENCDSLKNIEIPGTLKKIPSRTFFGCVSWKRSRLTRVSLPSMPPRSKDAIN